MYRVPANLERSPGREWLGPAVFKDTATDTGAVFPGAPASRIPEFEGREPDFDHAIEADIAFLGSQFVFGEK